MARPPKSSTARPEDTAADDGTFQSTQQLILAELKLLREQVASLVCYLRNKEAAGIKRKNTLYTRTDIPIVAKHKPTEEEVQAAVRQQIRWKAQQK